ncbi:levansucrase [Nocardioides sp. GY 10127]|uniref:levansucrase n=1 Tax=Nocardioides sp. GY 10127 TaxID=2569762 RepID=UPI0010A7D44D|nr:levansucrase [Nocardioides sp. GY 10127]TIC84375.1 levansucrase [Nocardioides sp. GY 10127]
MTTHEEYLSGLRARLAADGCTVGEAQLRGGRAVLGHRADFRLQWMATRLHLVTLALPWSRVDAPAIESFVEDAWAWARANKKGLPVGMQSGLAVFPVLVGEEVSAVAKEAVAGQRHAFGTLCRPVAVDLSADGQATWFDRRTKVGGVFSGHLVRKGRAYFG